MLHDTVTLYVPTGMDRYQNKTYETHTISNVHLQSSSETRKAPNDTEVQLRGVLFVDARRSLPVLDLYALQQRALSAGDTMRAVVKDASGTEIGSYAVLIVDELPDVPATRRHHWELGLV
jgi:hypothetical protein